MSKFQACREQGYSTKSNCRRAASDTEMDLNYLVFYQEGGSWHWKPVSGDGASGYDEAIASDQSEQPRADTVVTPPPANVGPSGPGANDGVAPVAEEAQRAPKARRAPKAADKDFTVKPVITSAANKHMQALIDKIAAADGDAERLVALNTFKRTSTYYKIAGRYLDALLEKANAGQESLAA